MAIIQDAFLKFAYFWKWFWHFTVIFWYLPNDLNVETNWELKPGLTDEKMDDTGDPAPSRVAVKHFHLCKEL